MCLENGSFAYEEDLPSYVSIRHNTDQRNSNQNIILRERR